MLQNATAQGSRGEMTLGGGGQVIVRVGVAANRSRGEEAVQGWTNSASQCFGNVAAIGAYGGGTPNQRPEALRPRLSHGFAFVGSCNLPPTPQQKPVASLRKTLTVRQAKGQCETSRFVGISWHEGQVDEKPDTFRVKAILATAHLL